MADLVRVTLEERMEYAARRKKEMNCCQAVLCSCEDCVRNAVRAAGEALNTKN